MQAPPHIYNLAIRPFSSFYSLEICRSRMREYALLPLFLVSTYIHYGRYETGKLFIKRGHTSV